MIFKRLPKKLLLAALALFGLNASALEKDDPRALTIYQVMVASFQHHPDGGEGYTEMWGPEGHMKNGNIKGVTAALDYIRELGANAIWLTPIFDSTQTKDEERLQSTGYFTNNYFAIDPKFGTEEDFRELVREAHARGMYVILDGVFGHHGGVTSPSPSGHKINVERVFSNRGEQGGTGNVKYPESLDYFKEVATYWIDKYGVDGWRLDQAYQATQNGSNYWNEIRGAVEDLAAKRKARGERWGTLGYMVGEDWGNADVINKGVYKDGGLLSAFDFDGKELISGPMQEPESAGLVNGWDDVVKIYSAPSARGYLNDKVMPNLFLSNHDGYRLADHFADNDSTRWSQMKLRNAILAAYSGPVTLYYGDEYGDLSRTTQGAQKDNIARTTGHLRPYSPASADLHDYVAKVMTLRGNNPALWRGTSEFERIKTPEGADVLIVTKTDKPTGNVMKVIFSDKDVDLTLPENIKVKVKSLIPEFVLIN